MKGIRLWLIRGFIAGALIHAEAVRFWIARIKRSKEFYTPLDGGGKPPFYSVNIVIEFWGTMAVGQCGP